jgi:predicted TPR repeat methyltransferase
VRTEVSLSRVDHKRSSLKLFHSIVTALEVPKMVKKVSLEDAYSLNSPEDNVRLYSKWAETYDTDFAQNSDYILPYQIAKAVHDTKNNCSVLDLGAGTGLLASELLKIGQYRIDATDISEDMLKAAEKKKLYEQLFWSDITDQINALNETYDICASSGTFTHGHVGPEALKEVLRVVKKGGAIVISVNLGFWKLKAFDVTFDKLRETVHSINFKYLPIYGEHSKGDHSQDQAVIATIIK